MKELSACTAITAVSALGIREFVCFNEDSPYDRLYLPLNHSVAFADWERKFSLILEPNG